MATNRLKALLRMLPGGLQAQLVVAFLLVSLVPTLFAAELAAYAVSKAFDGNVREWLRQTTSYFLSNTKEAGREAAGMAKFLAGRPSVLAAMIDSQADLPPPETSLLDAMGYDLILIIDDQGKQIYQSKSIDGLGTVALSDNIPLMRVGVDGSKLLMTAGTGKFLRDGKAFTVLVGSWLDDEFLGAVGEINALDIRLYLRSGDGFSLAYAARSGATEDEFVPDSVLRKLADTGVDFEKRVGPSGYYGLYTALHAANGNISGVVFCGLQRQTTIEPWLSRTNLVIIILVVGAGLAIGAALLVARILTRPVRELVSGVQAVIAGDYSSRVRASGRDEIAKLASAFNQMTESLEDLKTLELQLRRRDRLSALGQVAVGIAHEVRNPLGIIKTSAELLHKRIQTGQPYEQLLNYIIDEVRRIDKLIRDFLAFAKPRPPVMAPFDIREVIDRTCRFCVPELERCHVAITVDVPAGAPQVFGDHELIHQALLNLILNAMEAMPNGGSIAISAVPTDGFMAVSVADTGPGVAPEAREKLFNPFFTTKENGTGLGLAQVYSIMEAHGGAVEYSESSGQGAVFVLTLPLASVQA